MLSATAAFEMMRRASRRARRRWPALQDSDFHEVDREDVRAISLSSRAEVRSDDKAFPRRAVEVENGAHSAAHVCVQWGTLMA